MLDSSRAVAEPFVQYLEFKKTFNRQFKVSVAAIVHVSRLVEGAGGTRIMQGLVADTGEPWSKDFNWKHPAADLRSALRDTTRLGILQIHSAADDVLTGFEAELQRWHGFRKTGTTLPATISDEKVDPLEHFFTTRLGGSPESFTGLRPVLLYFRLTRNCIAHRSSRASDALAKASGSTVSDSLSTWAKKKETVVPPLPCFELGEEIALLPRHAILALQAVYRAADEINKKFVYTVGVEALTYLAAQHVLLADHLVEGLTGYKSSEAVLADAVSNRYGVVGFSSDDAVRALKKLGIRKDCTLAFERLFGQPPMPRTARTQQSKGVLKASADRTPTKPAG